MATFSTKKTLYGSPSLIPTIAARIKQDFENDDFDVTSDDLSSGAYDISITKGGTFKAVLGMQTALKVTLVPDGSNIKFEAGIGIWGKQFIPTVISMLFFWPVLITQIWGMVEQAKLDDRALDVARDVIMENNRPIQSSAGKFCTSCGTQNSGDAKFCCGCGKPLL